MVAGQPFRHDEQEILAAQLGLITRQQALRHGETAATIKTKLGRGEWVKAAHGVFRATLFPASLEQRILAQCLRSPGRVWASHRSAAWLHELIKHPPSELTVTTLGQLKAGPGVSVHRTTTMPACDAGMVRSVPCVGIDRTLIDLAVDASEMELEYAIDEALVTKRTSIAKIEWRLRRIGGRGTPGTAFLRDCLDARKRLGDIDSQLERRFLNLLRRAGVPLPELQFPITLGSRTVLADFAYPEHKLIIEVMGYRWHGGRDRWERDLLRSSELGAAGWRMIYVTKGQIVKAPRPTMDRIRDALGYGPLFVL